MIPANQQDALRAELPRFRQRHRLNAPELKWQQLARRTNGAAAFRDIFKVMLANGSVPFFQVMDKDFILAAKAVETFFDPAYNHFLPMAFTSAYDIKKDLAEDLLLAPAALAEFADLLRGGVEPKAGQVEALASHFADSLEERNTALAETLRRFGSESLADIGSEFGTDVWMRTTLGHSMFGLMNRLEQFLRPRDVRIDIVHDNIVRFEELLNLISGMFRGSDGSDALMIGGEIRFFSMPTVDRLRLSDSKDEPFIQLADLLCGFVRTVFTRLKRGQHLEPDELAVCGDLVMLRHDYYSWDVNVPRATFKQFQELGWDDLKQRSLP